MRATNKLDRVGRATHRVAVIALTVVAAGLMGCVTAPAYPSYDAGYGAGYAAGSNAHDNDITPTTYSSGYGSYDTNTPQPYPQQPAPAYSQPQLTYLQPSYSPYPSNGDLFYQASADNRYDVVEYVGAMPARGQPSGMGTVFGGVVGGLLGHQVDDEHGNIMVTVGGTMAGTMAGNIAEGNAVVDQTYRVTMWLNDNSRIMPTQNNPSDLCVGDHARIENNMAVSY